MDEGVEEDAGAAVMAHPDHGRPIAAFLEEVVGNTDFARVDEGQRQVDDVRPHILIDPRGIADIALPVREALDRGVVVARLREEMSLGVPQLVAVRLIDVPAEPPVEHLGSRAGEGGPGGDAELARGRGKNARLDRKIAGLEKSHDRVEGHRRAGGSLGGSDSCPSGERPSSERTSYRAGWLHRERSRYAAFGSGRASSRKR